MEFAYGLILMFITRPLPTVLDMRGHVYILKLRRNLVVPCQFILVRGAVGNHSRRIVYGARFLKTYSRSFLREFD